MKFFGDRHTKTLLLVYAILITAIPAAIGIFGAIRLTVWLWLPVGIWIVVGILFCRWYPSQFATRLQGTFDGQVIFAKMGVVIHRRIFIPRDALRNFELLSPPLHAACGCYTMLLRFAGGTVILPFLPAEQAKRLIDNIRREQVKS